MYLFFVYKNIYENISLYGHVLNQPILSYEEMVCSVDSQAKMQKFRCRLDRHNVNLKVNLSSLPNCACMTDCDIVANKMFVLENQNCNIHSNGSKINLYKNHPRFQCLCRK